MKNIGEKASQTVKAVVREKGWAQDGDVLLFNVISKMSKEQKDDTIKRKFGLAGMLHTNFYEGWLTEDEIKDCASQNKEFIAKIKDIFRKMKGR